MKTAPPKARSPSGQSKNAADAAPPAPVSGAPSGITKVVVVPDDLLWTPTGVTIVVLDPGTVVVAVPAVVVVPGAVVVVPAAVVVVVATVVVDAGGGGVAAQVGTVIVLESIVTAPFIANARPKSVAPVSSVTDWVAMIVPAKSVVVPNVADDVTCQNTLHAWAPFSKTTDADEPVMSVDPAWKIHTALGSFCPFSTKTPFRAMDDVALYTPLVSVSPVRSA